MMDTIKAIKLLKGMRVFVTSRERIKQPEGHDLFDKAIETLEAAESVAQGGMGGIVSEESVQSAYCVADAYIDSKDGDVSTLDDGHWDEMLRLVLENDMKEFAP